MTAPQTTAGRQAASCDGEALIFGASILTRQNDGRLRRCDTLGNTGQHPVKTA